MLVSTARHIAGQLASQRWIRQQRRSAQSLRCKDRNVECIIQRADILKKVLFPGVGRVDIGPCHLGKKHGNGSKKKKSER
jgi:hypothetical protein